MARACGLSFPIRHPKRSGRSRLALPKTSHDAAAGGASPCAGVSTPIRPNADPPTRFPHRPLVFDLDRPLNMRSLNGAVFFSPTLMFSPENGFLSSTRLVFCAATIAALTMSGSLAKEPDSQSAARAETSRLDSTTGFRGQKFGTPFSEFQGLNLERDEGDLKLYSKKDENLQLGPVKLETIVYHFFQDKFFAVSLHTKDRDNTLRLLRVAQVAFGPGNERPNAKEELDKSWLGKAAEAFFTVHPQTEEGSLFIRDNKLGSDVEAYWEKLTNEAANDL